MNIKPDSNQEPSEKQIACNHVLQVISPKKKDLGNVLVRRLLPSVRHRKVGPWVFFDHAGPARFSPGRGMDVRPHPHVCLATVSYLFEGAVMHRDSLGTVQEIKPGDINLMVAGRGIVHSERTPPNLRLQGHHLHLLQLWLALPEAHEETEPAFFHYPSAILPTTNQKGVAVRVMMGSAYGQTSPVKTYSETLYLEATLEKGQSLSLPKTSERAIYTAKGSLQIGNTHLDPYHLAILAPGSDITIHAEESSQIALVGGAPISKRFMEWNFVASSSQRIDKAKDDWRNRRFPTIPGDDQDFIPYP